LQKVLINQGPLPVATVIEVARQAGSALSAAHDAGIVHRDLKPENLFLIPDATLPMGFRVKVLDFGIAKIKRGDEKSSTLKTQAGLLMGSPSYMSPEQCRDSSDVDLRSDIYSFAIIVYEMLAGVPPFVSQSATEMLVMQITTEPPSLRQYVADVPEHVEESIMRALAKDRQQRFATVGHFIAALEGSAPAVPRPGATAGGLGRPVAQSFYARQGFGYQKTPAPIVLGGLGSRSNRTPAPVPSPTLTTLSHATGESQVLEGSPSMDSELEAIQPRRWPLLAGLGAVALAAGLFFALRPGAPGPSRAVAPPPPRVEPRPTPPPPGIRVQVRSSPAGATVLDEKAGTVLGMTPLEKSYPQGEGTLGLVLRLHGYKDKSVTVSLDASSTTAVDLERQPSSTGEAGAKAAGGKHASPPRPRPKAARPFREEEWIVH
jgi:hypothetical protein